MQIKVKGRNGAVPENLRTYAEKKVARLERYFRRLQSVEMIQATERGQHIVELTVEGDGIRLRSEHRSGDLHASVDNVVDKVERQIHRFKDRQRHDHQRSGHGKEVAAAGEAPETPAEERPPRISRRKRFTMKPMAAMEAARQMELLDHSFYLFHNAETGQFNVLYRRQDGDYGLIEPDS